MEWWRRTNQGSGSALGNSLLGLLYDDALCDFKLIAWVSIHYSAYHTMTAITSLSGGCAHDLHSVLTATTLPPTVHVSPTCIVDSLGAALAG